MFHLPSFAGRVVGVLAILGGVLGTAATVDARFIRPDLATVPVSRIVENLEKLARKNPKDVTVRFNLARAHAMAFALKADTAQVWKGREEQGAWFGFTPAVVPFQAKKTDDAAKKQQAEKHLHEALQLYQTVIKTSPDHLAARLGHAWLEEQAGHKMQAVQEYREVIEKAWVAEGKLKNGPLGGNFLTAEAAGYLIPLLDKTKDREEIQQLQGRIAQLEKLPRPITPIVIPLRDGLLASDLVNPNARVVFDADGSGLPRSWTWVNPEVGWLVHDPHGQKKVTSALQMFGNVTFWLFWDDGYQALRVLDDNGDGYLTGRELDGLAIWHDANGNGICEPGEVKSLAEWGIVKLSCRGTRDSGAPNCAAHAAAGVWFRDGTVRPTYDVILQRHDMTVRESTPQARSARGRAGDACARTARSRHSGKL